MSIPLTMETLCGGAWRNEARQSIAAFLAAALGDDITIIA